MTVRAALVEGAARLAAAGIPDPARDARRMLAAAMGVDVGRLTLVVGDPLPTETATSFARMLDERARFRPVAQIIGKRAFWAREFTVTSAVLDPRPETETLVALALAAPAPQRILDLGTGSGAILLTLLSEWPLSKGIGTDIDAAALGVAAENAERLGVAERVTLLRSDWLKDIGGCFDLVVSNPPYIAAAEIDGLAPDVRDWEPRHALTPGPTGLEAYARIAVGLGAVLAPRGRALFEIGAGQGAMVADLFRAAGFGRVRVHPDLDGRDRVVEIRTID